jgi:uncharacterized protein (TIGR03067 family)
MAAVSGWIVLSMAGCTSGPDAELAAAEMEKWRGRWQCVTRIEEGSPIPAEEAAQITLTVGGTVYHFRWGEDFDELGRYRFLPDREPKVIEATIESPPEMAGRVIPLIYRIDGDDMTFVHREDLTLPKEFTSDPESGQTLEVWRRIRP